ncbi:MAG: universal stress protein [Deltaproteobacteria bacterium]|nr:universal stress protein [Deltaproteobacteria bacterium]
MFKPSRILVPTDLSENAFRAAQQAFDIAKKYGSEVFVLHVVTKPVQTVPLDFTIDEKLVRPLQAEMDQSARKTLKDQLAKIPDVDSLKVTMDVRVGNPYEEILNQTEAKNIDLVVISAFGLTNLARLLLGSVARHVMMGSHCSVLLVK